MEDSFSDDSFLTNFDAILEQEVAILQDLVDSGAWRDNSDLKRHIDDKYLKLASLGANLRNFGSVEYWLGGGGFSDSDFADDFHYGGAEQLPIPDVNEIKRPSPDVNEIQGPLPDVSEITGLDNLPDFPANHFYRMNRITTPQYARRFRTERHHYSVSFINTDQLTSAPQQLEEIFDDILRVLLQDFHADDSTGLQIMHPALDRPIFIPLTKNSNLTGHKILTAIFRVIQSKTELRIDENLQIITISTRQPTGSGGRKRITNYDSWRKKKHSIINIDNNGDGDHLCLARAIVTAAARCTRDAQYETIRKGDQGRPGSLQKRLAVDLMQKAGLANHTGPCGIPECIKMQALIHDKHQIKIFSHDHQAFIFRGKSDSESIIYLYLKDNHFDVVTTITGFFNRSYWCESCEIGYNNKDDHRCNKSCPCCRSRPPCRNDRDDLVFCSECNRYFRGQACFDNHLRVFIANGNKKQSTGSSVCQRTRCCGDCGQHLYRAHKREHICGHFDCRTCKKLVPKTDHQCYIQPLHNADDEETSDEKSEAQTNLKEAKEKDKTRFVFFDFETTQCEKVGENENGAIYKHNTNLCVAQVVCDDCRNGNKQCRRCGPRQMVFKGENCLENFCIWLFSTEKPTTAIAHNAKGFDAQFLLQYLHKQGIIKPTIINKGLEIMSLSAGHVKVIDSLNFLPMALSSLPKAFGETELAKGYFPHLFNTPTNWDYVGPWPEKKYYSPDSMKENAKRDFDKWYAEQEEKVFDFQTEILQYCVSDVDILRRCFLKFRDIFLEKTNVEPYESSLTIASACNRVFRTLFLKEDVIGVIPHGGYRRVQKQSIIALKWLKWVSKCRNIQIRHARNFGEFRVEPHHFYADGQYENEIFEFHGCYWHGCRLCMKDRSQPTADQHLTAEEAFTRTVKRCQIITSLGYTVTEMWECELNHQLRADSDMKDFFDAIKIAEPMDPREAFYGGRTNAVRLYDTIARDENNKPLERIDYTDICSLYPYVCKYGKFPVGHAEIITENFMDLTTKPYEGLIKCRILPPRKLLHPLLPYRSNGKLAFPLCATCTNEMQEAKCKHNDNQRALSGSWVLLEIYKAIELGYKVIEIFEVYHYPKVEQYDPINNPTGGLFTEYINMFIKMKQEADGWPAWVETKSHKKRYIRQYFEKEGVQLEKSNIVKNPGLRSLSKLMLNSFWGKFGQRNNKAKIDYFTDPAEYFAHINEAGRVINSILIVSEHMIAVTSSFEDDFVEVMGNTNPVIAAYTTAQARLKLYSYIENLGDRLCYFDTDSIIFKSKINNADQYVVPTGSYLGDMTNELKDFGPDAFIEEFVSTGPKSYAYKVHSPGTNTSHYCIKVKGFSLTTAISQHINFDVLKALVHKFVKEKYTERVTVKFAQIARTSDRNIITKTAQKQYKVVYTKRVIQEDFSTLPYGY